ncbi:hypothetical protein [Terribacillus saccharophilus]|nr:hypothetical protein [Terribacillus saccharophilus]
MKKLLVTVAVVLTLGASIAFSASHQDIAFDSHPRGYTIINLPF